MLMVQMCVMFNVSNGNKHADKFTVAHQQEEIVQELDHHTRTIGIRETSITAQSLLYSCIWAWHMNHNLNESLPFKNTDIQMRAYSR